MVDFTIYNCPADGIRFLGAATSFTTSYNLAAVRRLVEMGKADVVEFIPALEARADSAAALKR